MALSFTAATTYRIFFGNGKACTNMPKTGLEKQQPYDLI
jgi:hypothetical protein